MLCTHKKYSVIGLSREGSVSDDSDTHPMKQPSLMTLTEDGIVIDNRDEHPKKHCSPMTLTEDEMDTEGIGEHLQKQKSPMTLTDDGIWMAELHNLQNIHNCRHSLSLIPAHPPRPV